MGKPGKIIQLATTHNIVYALDDKGYVWELCVDMMTQHEWWERKPTLVDED